MKFNIIGGAASMALVLSSAPTFSQTTTAPANQPNWTNQYNPNAKQPPAVFGNDSGYSGGGAASQDKPSGQYDQGNAQSLVPSSAMGQYEQTGGAAQKTKSQ
jgi:hypothetical protein